MKKKLMLGVSCVLALAVSTAVPAKTVTLDELKKSNASYVPAVNVSAKDFDNSHWAYKSLENITRKYGLIIGDSDEKFSGAKPLTRNEAAVILVNLIGKVQQDRISLQDSEKLQIDILKNELSGEITALTGRVAALEGDVKQLKGTVSKIQDGDNKTFKTGFGDNFKIGGGLQVKYNGILGKGADNASAPPNFSFPTSDVRISGKLAPHLDYMSQMVVSRTWSNSVGNTAATNTSTSNSIGGILGDAYVSTDIIPHHKVLLGQSRIPIGIEGTMSPYSLNSIDRSQISRNFSDYRDMGVKVTGSWDMADYYLGAFNGSGMNYKDYNNSMGVGGWLVVKPLYKLPKYGKLELGGGYYRQGNGSTTNSSLASKFETHSYGFNLGYKYKKHNLRSEFAVRNGYVTKERVANGLYAEYMYELSPKVQLLAKYDVFDPYGNGYAAGAVADALTKKSLNTEYTLGVNYLPAKNNIKFQFDGVYVNNRSYNDSFRLMALSQYVF